jgi:hypothetical protein
VASAKRRKVEEPHCKTCGLATPFGEIAKQARLGRKKRINDLVFCCSNLAGKLLLVRQLTHQCKNQRAVCRTRAADREAHTATSALICGCGS